MAGLNDKVSELADLMAEFKLSEAEWSDGESRVAFSKRRVQQVQMAMGSAPQGEVEVEEFEPEPAAPAAPIGTPISSPMTGIYYASPSPTAAPFVREGDVVAAGQVVGLIEAMKVFNEIVSSVSGTVKKVVAESGAVVNPGDPLLYIG